MAAHESVAKTDEWYTPPLIFREMGIVFDVDGASPGAEIVPWIPAHQHSTKEEPVKWRGKVFLNPPFGRRNAVKPWIDRMCQHGNGVLLVPNRTAAEWWQVAAYYADILVFREGKIKFLLNGKQSHHSPGFGNVFMGFGECATLLAQSKIKGLKVWP